MFYGLPSCACALQARGGAVETPPYEGRLCQQALGQITDGIINGDPTNGDDRQEDDQHITVVDTHGISVDNERALCLAEGYKAVGLLQPTEEKTNADTNDGTQNGDHTTFKKEDMYDLGDIIQGKRPGRESDEQVIVFSVGGMPVEDVAWGKHCYERALELGLGQSLRLWEKPDLA